MKFITSKYLYLHVDWRKHNDFSKFLSFKSLVIPCKEKKPVKCSMTISSQKAEIKRLGEEKKLNFSGKFYIPYVLQRGSIILLFFKTLSSPTIFFQVKINLKNICNCSCSGNLKLIPAAYQSLVGWQST